MSSSDVRNCLSFLENETATLSMLSNMGVLYTTFQVSLRDRVRDALSKHEGATRCLKEANSTPPTNGNEKELMDILCILFGLLFPEGESMLKDGDALTGLRSWYRKRRQSLGDRSHVVGQERVGSMIDRRPEWKSVAKVCTRARAINVGQKKKESQRDAERRKKEEAARKEKGTVAFEQATSETSKTSDDLSPPPLLRALSISQNMAQARLCKRLEKVGVKPYKEIDPDLTVKKPVGHSTHNLFLKAKVSKKEKYLVLVTVRQSAVVNLKELAKKMKVKSLRMASEKDILCIERGCITILSLYNDTSAQVVPVIDKSLLDEKSLRICIGCDDPLDHSQHNVVDIAPSEIMKLLEESNHKDIRLMEFEEQ